jgi:pilus assembly protein CpaB
MNRRLTSIIAMALVVATGASYIVYRLIQARMAAASVPASNRIIVASRTLETGTLIREADLTYGNWVGAVPKGFGREPKDFVGRGVISPIYDGEPVTEGRVAPVGAGAGLAATIPPGMRACAVRVNEVVGVAGFVVPGMRVDVLIEGTNPGSGPGQAATGTRVKTLLQNVEVLSAGQNYQKDAEGKPVQVQVVNLLVTPEQAETLSLASNETHIQLVLRNPLDTQIAKTSGTAIGELFADPSKPAPVKSVKPAAPKPVPPPAEPIAAPPVKQTMLIEVLNGSKRSEAKFNKPEENQ